MLSATPTAHCGPSGIRTLDDRGLKARRSATELMARSYGQSLFASHHFIPSVGRAGLEPAYSLLIRQEPSPVWPPASCSESQHRTDDLLIMSQAL
jgi:hypothetical protein